MCPFMWISTETSLSYVDDLPKPGETVQCVSFSEGFGGKGANACVMASRLGARCAIITKVSCGVTLLLCSLFHEANM